MPQKQKDPKPARPAQEQPEPGRQSEMTPRPRVIRAGTLEAQTDQLT